MSLSTDCADLIVTSPPYLGMIDYAAASRLTYLWYGWSLADDRKAEIAITDSSLIRATKSLAFTQQGHQGGIVKNKLQIAS